MQFTQHRRWSKYTSGQPSSSQACNAITTSMMKSSYSGADSPLPRMGQCSAQPECSFSMSRPQLQYVQSADLQHIALHETLSSIVSKAQISSVSHYLKSIAPSCPKCRSPAYYITLNAELHYVQSAAPACPTFISTTPRLRPHHVRSALTPCPNYHIV